MTSLKHERVHVLNTGSDLKAKVSSLSPIAEVLPLAKSKACGSVVYLQQSKTYRRPRCLLGSFGSCYFKSTSKGFSQVLRIKRRSFYLSNLLPEQRRLSGWIFLRIKVERQAPAVLREIEYLWPLLQSQHSVFAKPSVWSLWEIDYCLPSVTGALQA